MEDLERRVAELERLTRNGYSPLALKIRIDAQETQIQKVGVKVDDLDEKVDERFDKFGSQLWRVGGLIVGAMGVAATIIGLVLH